MAETKIVKFDLAKVTRNKCLAWDPKGNSGKGSGVYTNDLLNDDGTVNADACKAHSVDIASVVYLTPNDLLPVYRESAKAALTAAAKDSSMSNDDYVWSLVIADQMQVLANDSVKAHRPVTDRAKDRALSTLTKVFKAQGKSDQEIASLLKAMGQA